MTFSVSLQDSVPHVSLLNGLVICGFMVVPPAGRAGRGDIAAFLFNELDNKWLARPGKGLREIAESFRRTKLH